MTLAAVQALVNQSVYPTLCTLWKSGSADLASFLQSATYLMSRVSLLLCGAVILAAPWFVPFVYGPCFAETGRLLQVLAISQILVFNESITGPFLYAAGESRRYLIAVGSGAAVNIALDLFALPRFGPWGASCVMVATEMVVFSLMLFHSRRIMVFRTRQMLLLPIAIGLGSLYVLAAGNRYIPAICGGVALGAISLTSIPSMREAIRRIGLLGTDRQS
jgi:O-antigen/teichoic acid export membrane protein